MFIESIAPEDAQGDVAQMYLRQRNHWGFVPNYARAFSRRPEVLARWGQLLAEIKRYMPSRRFQLVTFVAAVELRSTGCALQYGKALRTWFIDEEIRAIATGDLGPFLGQEERALVLFARRVAHDASAIQPDDVDALRRVGLDDDEVFDVIAAVAGRAFFTKILDGVGVDVDVRVEGLAEATVHTLTVGRPRSGRPPTSE